MSQHPFVRSYNQQKDAAEARIRASHVGNQAQLELRLLKAQWSILDSMFSGNGEDITTVRQERDELRAEVKRLRELHTENLTHDSGSQSQHRKG